MKGAMGKHRLPVQQQIGYQQAALVHGTHLPLECEMRRFRLVVSPR
jgi:hypothetical protein